MKRVLKQERAKDDLFGHASYIAIDNPDAAIRLLDAARDAFEKLAAMPGMGPLIPLLRVGRAHSRVAGLSR